MRGSEEFTVRPVLPLYLPGRTDRNWRSIGIPARPVVHATDGQNHDLSEGSRQRVPDVAVTFPLGGAPLVFPRPQTQGLYVIEGGIAGRNTKRFARFIIPRSGFAMKISCAPAHGSDRESELLRAGWQAPRRRRHHLYGQRCPTSLLRIIPILYVWDQDLALIHSAGLNMIRTGWWTGWDKFCDENGQPYDRTLRTIEAYLMTARKNGLPVQFNFFAFLPDVLGGANPYLDPEAVRRQQTLVSFSGRRASTTFPSWPRT